MKYTFSIDTHPNELETSDGKECALLIVAAQELFPAAAEKLDFDLAKVAMTFHLSSGKNVRVSWYPG